MKWPSWLVAEEELTLADLKAKKEEVQLSVTVTQPQVFVQQIPSPVGLDQQQHEKWNNFFNELIATKGDPNYRQFMAMIDSMGPAIPDNVKFPSIFNGLKTMGLTKQGLLDAAQKTADMLVGDADQFKAQMDQRQKKEVEDPQKLIEEKNQQILKLQQEVADLTSGIVTAQHKIQLSILGYSTYFRQAQTKVTNDITSVNNFIPN